MYKYEFKLENTFRNSGTVYLPQKSINNIPVIIYCHGWGGSQRLSVSAYSLMRKAIKENIAFVSFDNFGCGKTGGDYSLMTYGKWAKCVEDVFDWVKAQSFSDSSKIGCFSISSGTTAAIRFAENADKPAFVISVATAITANIGMGQGGPLKIYNDNIDVLSNGGTAEIFGVNFPKEFYLDELQNIAADSMMKIKCPILFLQGSKDNNNRINDAKLGHRLMKEAGLDSKYIEIKGGNHGLDNKPLLCARECANWLKSIGI